MLERNAVHIGDVRELAGRLEPGSVQTIITSPPYYALRSYLDNGHADKGKELGSEATPAEYVANLVAVFRALREALKDDGTIWLNLGDSYNAYNGNRGASRSLSASRDEIMPDLPTGHGLTAREYPNKCLLGIPWRVAFALVDDGWILRSEIIWSKGNPMPESVQDRPTRSHEQIFLFAKTPRYFYDAAAIAEPVSANTHSKGPAYHAMAKTAPAGSGIKQNSSFEAAIWQSVTSRNKRTVWEVNPAQFPDAHYATFPPALIRPCVLAGTSERGECARCGKAWGRVVERGVGNWEARKANGAAARAGDAATYHNATHGAGMSHDLLAAPSVTTGWAPRCSCPPGTPTRPQVVLDPFMGSGTTAQVAHELGRDWIGCDLDERALKWTADRLARFPVGMLPGLAG